MKKEYADRQIKGSAVKSTTTASKGTKIQFLKGVTGEGLRLSYLPGDITVIFDKSLIEKLIKGGYAKEC